MNLQQLYALIKRYIALYHHLRGNIRDDDYKTLIEVYTVVIEHYNKLMMFADEDGFLHRKIRINRDMKAVTFIPTAKAGDIGEIIGWQRDHRKVYTFHVKFETDKHRYFIKRIDFEVVE